MLKINSLLRGELRFTPTFSDLFNFTDFFPLNSDSKTPDYSRLTEL